MTTIKYNDIRRHTGATAEEWAERLGVSRQTISRRYRLRLAPFDKIKKHTFYWKTQDGKLVEVEV